MISVVSILVLCFKDIFEISVIFICLVSMGYWLFVFFFFEASLLCVVNVLVYHSILKVIFLFYFCDSECFHDLCSCWCSMWFLGVFFLFISTNCCRRSSNLCYGHFGIFKSFKKLVFSFAGIVFCFTISGLFLFHTV